MDPVAVLQLTGDPEIVRVAHDALAAVAPQALMRSLAEKMPIGCCSMCWPLPASDNVFMSKPDLTGVRMASSAVAWLSEAKKARPGLLLMCVLLSRRGSC